METRSQHRRRTAISGLLLVFQFAVAAVVPMADAVLESVVRTGPAHVEAPSGGVPCPPGHDHLLCQFCRLAGPNLLKVVAQVMPAGPPAQLGVRASADTEVPPIAVAGGPIGPRAPPRV